MWRWIRANWGKSLAFLALGYVAHIFIEAFIVTNLLALAGIKIPVLVTAVV